MMSINQLHGSGIVAYLQAEYLERYYKSGSEREGFWCGSGAELLGVSRKVMAQQLHNLLNGFSPDGKTKLVQNAGSEDRQSGWDTCFSAPKPFSMWYALLPPAQQERALRVHLLSWKRL